MSKAKKILVCGSLRNSPDWVMEFVTELGRLIVQQPHYTLVTGGLKETLDGKPAADACAVEGAKAALGPTGVDLRERVLTMLPQTDRPGVKRLESGNVVRVSLSHSRSRRYSMVLSCDAVVAVEGAGGTADIIDLAWAAKRPVLPLACTQGASRSRWEEYSDQLVTELGITNAERELLERAAGVPGVLAATCLDILRRNLKPQCFVAMEINNPTVPGMYEVIRRVLTQKGYSAVRVDLESVSGDIVAAIREGIRNAALFVADLTGYNPNVMYELGIAQALDKESMLIIYDPDGQIPANLPFDIRAQRVHAYGTAESLEHLLGQHIRAA